MGRFDRVNRLDYCFAVLFVFWQLEATAMSRRDVLAIVVWFQDQIARLENLGNVYQIREGLNRMRGFVEVLEGELDGKDHQA